MLGHDRGFSSVRSVIEYKNAAVSQNRAATSALDYRFVSSGLVALRVLNQLKYIASSHDAANIVTSAHLIG